MDYLFAFSGQGAQAVGMGRSLYDSSPAARSRFEAADAALGCRLSEIIFNGPAEKLTESRYCQTAIYTMSCAALAAFYERFPEQRPCCCAGLSLGEYAALFAAGAFDFETGLRLLARRGELMDEACRKHPGGMASVLGGDRGVIAEVCAECDIDIANYNSPGQIVISGEKERVAAAVEKLRGRGMRKIVELNVAGAFHSRLMREAGEALREALEQAEIRMPQVPVFHNFSAAPAASVEEIRELLVSQVAGSVRWEDCLRAAVAGGAGGVIEFGPGNVLTGLARRTVPELKLININSSETLAAAEL